MVESDSETHFSKKLTIEVQIFKLHQKLQAPYKHATIDNSYFSKISDHIVKKCDQHKQILM